jgi:hypothetical protein
MHWLISRCVRELIGTKKRLISFAHHAHHSHLTRVCFASRQDQQKKCECFAQNCLCVCFFQFRKAILPCLWSTLRARGHGSPSIMYPCVLPLLSLFPPLTSELMDPSVFTRFMVELWKGYDSKLHDSRNEIGTLLVDAYFECVVFAASRIRFLFCHRLFKLTDLLPKFVAILVKIFSRFRFFMIPHVELQPLCQGFNLIQPSFELRPGIFLPFFSLFRRGSNPILSTYQLSAGA